MAFFIKNRLKSGEELSDSERVKLETNENTHSCKIQDACVTDAAIYTVQISNEHGKIETKSNVTIISKYLRF